MNFKHTACLALLLMACPLVAPSISVATDWNWNSSQNFWYYGLSQADNAGVSGNHATSLPESRPEGSSQEGFAVGVAVATKGNANASNNTFTFTGGKFFRIIVGWAGNIYPYNGGSLPTGYECDNATADGNRITLTDAMVDNSIECAVVAGDKTATANGNTVELNGGTYGSSAYSHIYSCYLVRNSTVRSANNSVILRGGTYNGEISACRIENNNFEDYGQEETATNNSVKLYVGADGKSPEFSETTLICGVSVNEDFSNLTLINMEGNSLQFYDVKGMTAGNIENFQKLYFEYSEMHAGDVILELKGYESYGITDLKTSIANADVEVKVANLYGADGQSEFKTGDKVVLLKNDNGIETEGIETKATITAKTGISLTYEVEVQADDKELYLIRTGTKSDVQPGTKVIAEGAAAGLALAGAASNTTIELLRDLSFINGVVTPFVHVQSSSMRYETGSSVNMSTVSLAAGLGYGFETGAGNLGVGAFFEYGKGAYTTSNSFDNRSDIDGDGNSWYMGGGILAKMEFLQTGPGHFYLDGSAHMGTLHNEYDSNDLYDANGNVAKFDMDSPYYSLHGGLGYVWNMAEGHDLDIYGKYIWTRVQGTDDTLTTKDKFEYDDMDSNRIRLGARYTYKGSERFIPYVGAAFEHEFSGSCDSRAFGHSVAAPSFEGSSGMGELGLKMKPSEEVPLSINLGVQGYVGQKQGVSGNCMVMYEF